MTNFLYQELTRNPEIGNTPVWVFLNICIWRLRRVRDTKFAKNVSNVKLLHGTKCQSYSPTPPPTTPKTLSLLRFVNLTLLGMRWRAKSSPPTSFSPVTSTNVRTSPQNLLAFSFDPFAKFVWNFKTIRIASPKLLNLN